MTQLQGTNYSRFFDRRSLLYCVPGDWRNVLNLFILQTFDLPEGRICLHRREQSSRAGVPEELDIQPWFMSSSTISWLRHSSRALPLILATGFLVRLFLFTDPLQHSSPVPGGPKPSEDGQYGNFITKLWSLPENLPDSDSILNTSCRAPRLNLILPKATAATKISVPLLRGVTAPALPKAHPLLHL